MVRRVGWRNGARDDMADFVREDAGDFGLVLGDKQEAAVDVEDTSGYWEGLYLFGAVDDFDFVFNVGAVLQGGFYNGSGDALDVGL